MSQHQLTQPKARIDWGANIGYHGRTGVRLIRYVADATCTSNGIDDKGKYQRANGGYHAEMEVRPISYVAGRTCTADGIADYGD